MNTLTICFSMINRGRHIEESTDVISSTLRNHSNIIFVFGESDSTEKGKGLDGRNVIVKSIEKSNRNDLQIVAEKDEKVGMNFVYSNEITVDQIKWEHINSNDLKHPQGASERYPHHRLVFTFKFSGHNFVILAQHQSAFIRPFSRFRQAKEIFKQARAYKELGYYPIILRDQNSFLPGEWQLEKILRKKYKIGEITKNLRGTYNVGNIESDSGGLNALSSKFLKLPILGKIIVWFINTYHKLDSICICSDIPEKYSFSVFTKKYQSLDHELVGIKIPDVTN